MGIEEFIRSLSDDALSDDEIDAIAHKVEVQIHEELAERKRRPVPAREGIDDPCAEPDDVRIVQVRRQEGNTTYIYGGVHCGGCGTTHYFPFSKHTCIAISQAVERLEWLKDMMYRMQGAAKRADAPCSIYDECVRGRELIDGIVGDIEFIDHEEKPGD